MDVEALAVSKISNMIARCPHLKAYVSTNDKTPFTDGYIDLYSGPRHVKTDWKGRVPVQVKGRTRTSKKNVAQAYGISRTDLRAYQKDSGVLYLVVTIDPKTGHETPYYALLSPFAIESLLDRVPDKQSQVSVRLKKLSNDPVAIERLISLALKTREQSMELGFDPLLIENLQSFTIYTADTLNFDSPVTLAPGSNDFALVMNTNNGLSVPFNGEFRILPPEYLKKDVDLRVRSGETFYDGVTVKRVSEENLEIYLSPGLTLLLRNESGRPSAKLSLTLERTLADRRRAIRFYLALLETGVIEFNGKPSPFIIVTSDDTARLQDHLRTLDALFDLFEYLGVDTRLVYVDEIDEVQIRQLRVLHRAFVLDEEIEDEALETSRAIQRVGAWELMFLIMPGSSPGKWRFIDPFSPDARRQFRWSSDEPSEKDPIPVTAYDVVEQEHLSTVLNMRLDAIVGAYEAIADFPSTLSLANQRVLALITAADTSELRKAEVLSAADRLNDWLLAEEGSESRHLINGWQIASRRGPLSAEQRREIRACRRQVVRDEVDDSGHLELACAILLGDEDDVQELADLLSAEQLAQMQSWPIWNLRGSLARKPDIVGNQIE
jgi:hypothetical protein